MVLPIEIGLVDCEGVDELSRIRPACSRAGGRNSWRTRTIRSRSCAPRRDVRRNSVWISVKTMPVSAIEIFAQPAIFLGVQQLGSTTRRRRRAAQAVDDDLDGKTEERIVRKTFGATRKGRLRRGVCDLAQRFHRCGANIDLRSRSRSARTTSALHRRRPLRAQDRTPAAARPRLGRRAAAADAACARPASREGRPCAPVRMFASSTRR